MSQRSLPGWSACRSHFRIDQKTNAVKNDDNAYTSPSTALYQNESENVYANAPTTPQLMIVKTCCLFNGSLFFPINLRAKWVIDQKRNKIVNPLAIALI